MDRVALEFDFENSARSDNAKTRPSSDAVQSEFHELLEAGDTTEIWQIVE